MTLGDFRLLHVTTARLDVAEPFVLAYSRLHLPNEGGSSLKLSALPQSPSIAVLLPCYNEEAAIAATVAGFRAALPDATIYVYDNNSRDRTREIAAEAGAVVRSERQQGKGHVVRRMFADIDADVYVMADGDLTYDPKAAPAMVDLLARRAARHGRRHSPARGEGRLSRRPRAREQAVHRPARGSVRAQLQRHLLGLPRVLAALREELSGAVVGVRDRNRDERSRARAEDAGRRSRNRLRRRGPRARIPSCRPMATAGGS